MSVKLKYWQTVMCMFAFTLCGVYFSIYLVKNFSSLATGVVGWLEIIFWVWVLLNLFKASSQMIHRVRQFDGHDEYLKDFLKKHHGVLSDVVVGRTTKITNGITIAYSYGQIYGLVKLTPRNVLFVDRYGYVIVTDPENDNILIYDHLNTSWKIMVK